MFLQVSTVLPGQVFSVPKQQFRVAAIYLLKSFDLKYHINTFIIVVLTQVITADKTIKLADVDLLTKFYICPVLSPDHRPDMRLININDPITAAVNLVLRHIHLFIKDVLDQPVDPLVPFV